MKFFLQVEKQNHMIIIALLTQHLITMAFAVDEKQKKITEGCKHCGHTVPVSSPNSR